VHEGRICPLVGELNRFIIPENETPQEMLNRLNKIVNKIRALGGDKWSDKDVVDKILTAYMARDVNLPTLVREKRDFKRFTPANVIGRMEQHLTTTKEAKISQELSRIHEQMENNGIALKSSLKEKAKTKIESTSSKKKESDSDNDSDDDMALFIKRFKKVMKKDGYFNNYKRRGNVIVRAFIMLGIYFVSVKYVFVKCKACVCLCETFENLKVQIKRVTFVITEKPRVVFVKCIG
jgi:hypothetical protein